MVRARAWLVMLPLLVVASELGQWLLDRVAAATGEAALYDHSPLGNGMLALLLAVAFVTVGAGALLDDPSRTSVTMPRRVFAVLPLCVFVVQEHMEYLAGAGRQPWTVTLHWSFAAGLLIQLPLVLAGYALARLLIRVAKKVFGSREAVLRTKSRVSVVARLEARALPRRARPLRDARLDRGPPLPSF
jgi:hypothetical protein